MKHWCPVREIWKSWNVWMFYHPADSFRTYHGISGFVEYHIIEGEGLEEGVAISHLSERPPSGTNVETNYGNQVSI